MLVDDQSLLRKLCHVYPDSDPGAIAIRRARDRPDTCLKRVRREKETWTLPQREKLRSGNVWC